MADINFTPSQSQVTLMATVLKLMVIHGSLGAVKIDWDRAAKELDMARWIYARDAWNVLRKQIEAGKTSSSSPGKGTAAKPGTPSKKRKIADENGSGELNGDDRGCKEAPKANGVKRTRKKAGNQDDGKLAKPKKEDDE